MLTPHEADDRLAQSQPHPAPLAAALMPVFIARILYLPLDGLMVIASMALLNLVGGAIMNYHHFRSGGFLGNAQT